MKEDSKVKQQQQNKLGLTSYFADNIKFRDLIRQVGFRSQKLKNCQTLMQKMNYSAKQYFKKQISNKRGYAQYKFISIDSKSVNEEQVIKRTNEKNGLIIRINQHQHNEEQTSSLIALINEKDQIISKMDSQIKRLLRETKKLNKSLSKQKANNTHQFQRNISLNVKLNPSQISMLKNSKNDNTQWQKQREEYQLQIEKYGRKIRDHETKQRHLREEIQSLRKRIEVQLVKDNQKRTSNLKKQIEDRYENDRGKKVTVKDQNVEYQQNDREKKNRYIEEQLANQLKKIEAEKERQLRKDNVQKQLKYELQRQNIRQKDRQKEKQYQKTKQKERQKQKQKSRAYLRQSSFQHREFLKQISALEQQRQALKQKLELKDDELHSMVIKLQKAQIQIQKLEDENIELRKTKSSLLREVQSSKMFKSQSQKQGSGSERQPIQQYEKMIINERKQIVDQKLRAELDELRAKIKRQEKQFKQKFQQKQMQLMKLKLTQKSANRQKQIYSTRIKQMMENVEGDRKTFLQAMENASKYEVQQARTKQLEIANNELETNNNKLIKEKQEIQNSMKKMKTKIDQRQGEWVRLKSIESQHDYYRNQCQKLEKAYKKFEKQYQSIKQYCQNLQQIVGKKPRKTFDDEINNERQQRYKAEVRNRMQILIQEVKDMQNKFYKEQIEIWLTERTNIIQYYAKKLQQDKARINDIENISQQAKANLLDQKLKQISSLKDQQIEDVDRKITKLKALLKGEDLKIVNAIIDKNNLDKILGQFSLKIEKLKQIEQAKNKEVMTLKDKNIKLQSELKEKSKIIENNQFSQKRSLSLFPQDKDSSKADDIKKSYLDEFKKSRDFYMNKPFEELKKLNAQLQTQKRKIESELNTHKFNFDKERVQFNQKLRTKERQLKKLQHESATNQKSATKFNNDVQNLKKNRDQLQSVIKKLREQLKQVSKTLQLKQRQCSEALKEIQRMEKNLNAYEAAEKRMFEDVKKMKQKLEKRQIEMEGIMEQRNFKSKQIDAERVNEISKLEQKLKQLQFKLENEIAANLGLTTQKQKLSQLITEYEVKLKDSQYRFEALDQNYDIYKTQMIQKQAVYEQQTHILQNNILQIANQMEKKQNQCAQLQIKLQYAQKREEVVNNIKTDIQQQNKNLKTIIEQLKDKQSQHMEKINEQLRAYTSIKDKIDAYVQQNARLNLKIKQVQAYSKNYQKEIHQLEKQMIRAQCEKKNVQTEISYVKESHTQQIKKLEQILTDKNLQIQKIKSDRSRPSIEQKARNSNDAIEFGPGSPVTPTIQRKMLNTSIQRSNSLIQGPKSNKNLSSSSLVRKNSSKQRSPHQENNNELMYFSKQGIEVNILKPVKQLNTQDLLKSVNEIKNEVNASKIDLELSSNQDNPPTMNMERMAINDKEMISPNKTLLQQKPVELKRDYTEQQQQLEQSQYNYEQLLQQNQQLNQKLHEALQQVQQLTQQRDIYANDLAYIKGTSIATIKQSIMPNQSFFKLDEDRIKGDNLQLLKNFNHDHSVVSKRAIHKSTSQIPNQHPIQLEKSTAKKIEILDKEIDDLKNKVIQYELQVVQNENHIKQLEDSLVAEQDGREKLIVEVNNLLQNLEEQVYNNKQAKNQMAAMQQNLQQKVADLQAQLQQVVGQQMKKDQALNQTMMIIENLNKQLNDQKKINQALQTKTNSLNTTIDKCNKTISNNKSEYRKYEQQAELQILRLREKEDDLNLKLKNKDEDIMELAERYNELEHKTKELNNLEKIKENQILAERAKVKDANFKRDQAIEEMRKFDSNKAGLMNRIGDLEIKLSQKNQQLKQLVKQTAIAYKKYQIQIDTQKQQHVISKKKVKERDEHLTNLKLQLANYNDKCYEFQKQNKKLNIELSRLENELKDIMYSYQQELDQVHKDKISLSKQLQNSISQHKDNEIKMQALNKEINKKNREIKEITFKIEQQQSSIQKIKQKNRIEVSELISNLQIKNDQYHKIKIQLQRETEHYFTKECEFLAEKERKDKVDKQYNAKLEGYQSALKQLEEQLKQIQNRPSIDQWEQVCFQNELYKNRIQELQLLQHENGELAEQKIMAQFKRYKIMKEKEIQDLQAQMEKYGVKFQNLQENGYILKKDNDTMKTQLRTLMQQKMRLHKSIKQYEEDIRQLKEQLTFYKAKRVDDLNKLLNETYD